MLVAENFVSQNMSGTPTGERVTLVDFRIANCGKEPALTVELLDNIKLAGKLPSPPDFSDCKDISLRNRVVGASKEIEAFIRFWCGSRSIRRQRLQSNLKCGRRAAMRFASMKYRRKKARAD